MIDLIEYIKHKIRTRKAIRKSNVLAQEIIVWMSANKDATMYEFTTMMEGHGFFISGFSITGDEVVFANNDDCQINVCLALGEKDTDEQSSVL